MQTDVSSREISIEPIAHLGQLLLQAGLISTEQLAEVGGSGEVPPPRLGSKLVIAQAISHNELHEALYVQSLLREHVVDRAEAAAALRLIREQDLDVEGAFACLGLNIHNDLCLGDLLAEAQLITRSQLRNARLQAVETGYPLSSILLLFGLADVDLLKMATEAQIALRNAAVTRQDVIKTLSRAPVAAAESRADTEPVPALAQPAAVPRKPGSPQVAAGDIPPSPQSTREEKTPPQNPAVSRTVRFTDFLLLCGLLKFEDVERAQKMRDGTQFGIDTVVRKMHSSNNVLVELAGYCYRQMQLGSIEIDDAVYAVDYCKGIVEGSGSHCTAAEAAARLSLDCGIKLM